MQNAIAAKVIKTITFEPIFMECQNIINIGKANKKVVKQTFFANEFVHLAFDFKRYGSPS